MNLLSFTPIFDDCVFYTLSVLVFWAMPTTFFTDFKKEGYWKDKMNRRFNIAMAICLSLELAILLFEHL